MSYFRIVSAVAFAVLPTLNHTEIREELKGQDLSFTEIAKLVGERWQVLDPGVREAFEKQAASAKEKYYAQMAEYKKTTQYQEYQQYLADFKAKHATPRAGELLQAFGMQALTCSRRQKIEASVRVDF